MPLFFLCIYLCIYERFGEVLGGRAREKENPCKRSVYKGLCGEAGI